MPVEWESLKNMLENAHKGFAYELLALEIQIQYSKDEKNEALIQNLSKLIQLYMLGVEVLESNWDSRYKYFNDKIQGLMKKKHIIQQLHVASTGDKNVPKEALVEANKQLRENRKNEHEINIFINSDQCNIRRVKEIVRKQEAKMANFESRLKVTMQSQESKINERIQRRKMRSQCFSARKFDLGSNPPQEKMKQTMNDNDDIFAPHNRDYRKNLCKGQRRGSTEKKRQIKL